MLKETYLQLLKRYTDDSDIINHYWSEIESNHLCPKRSFHTLSYLEDLLNHILEVKDEIENWDSILFTLFYHRIFFNALDTDKGVQSAAIAEDRMMRLNVPKVVIDVCMEQIISVRKSCEGLSSDMNYFTDAYFSYLGKETEVYDNYSQSIRNECLYFPSAVYNQRRIKFLKQILFQKSIYKTDYFREKLEKKARCNILQEIKIIENIKNEIFLAHSQQWCFNIESDGDWCDFFQNGSEILEETEGVEKISYYQGFFDEGYYKFYFKNVKLNLEYEGTMGTILRTSPNPTEKELKAAKEIYKLLKNVRNYSFA